MERNRKKIFTFTHTHTKPKSENSVQHLSCQKLLKQQHALPAVRGTTEPLPCTSPESILSISTFICVCEHLSFILIYFVHSLARWVLRQLLLYFRPFWLTKGFTGIALLSDSGGNLYHINFKNPSIKKNSPYPQTKQKKSCQYQQMRRKHLAKFNIHG